MANRKQPTGKSVGGKTSPPEDDGSAQRIPESYDRFYQAWSSFREDLEGQIDENLKKQQKLYDDFFGRWNRLSGEMGSRLSREKVNEAQREFYDVWRNYSNKMGPRMAKAMTEGLQGYGNISASLQRYSTKVGEEVKSLMEQNPQPEKLEHVYGAWLEFGTTLRKQMEKAMSTEWAEADEVSKTWFEFSRKIQQLVTDLGETGDYTELAGLWQKFSAEIGDSLIQVVNGTGKDMDKLQKTWTEYYSKVEKEMMKLANDIGIGYEEMYARFFEQQGETLERMSKWWQTTSDTARKQLDDMQSRLFEVEKRVREATR